NKKILLLDIALAVAGTSYRGEFEARLKEIIKEATENKDVILFIDEIHNIVGAGNANGGLDAANILKPALSRGDVQCIGATTLGEYKKHIEKDPALERRLQPVKIAEPSVDDTREIIEGIKSSYEKFHNIAISREATDYALDLSVRYVQDRFLPDKTLDVIDETASYVRNKNKISDFSKEIKKMETEKEKIHQRKNDLINDEKYEEAVKLREEEKRFKNKLGILRKKQAEIESQNPVIITSFDIATIVSQMTGLPLEKLSRKHSEKIDGLEKRLNSQIVGQGEAIGKLVNAIYRSQSGISNPDRPLGSFLFLGPTGVGKTLTAKILAQDFFENPDSLIRIDMSEFMERHSVAQMIGAPAGYVGYGEGGKLTEKVRRNPYSLVLFDEIEKAHPDVFNILLQILEDGCLTDAEGRQINFKNTLIILTSNMGTAKFTDSAKIGFESKSSDKEIHNQFDAIKNKVLEDLKKQIKPEFLNRLDNIVVFNALGAKEIRKIVRLELNKLKKRLKDHGLILSCPAKVMNLISKKSVAFDQGARLVRKNVQEMIENEIAKMVVDKETKNNKIGLDIKREKITVQ
ncbi:MAG TPA: ATP-dependent Clp protease ATP-binding subunit, partial [Candidatus Moranbacteria bacterium]|nr:ATP-dependent Clp protease ATP-binding subunit [Candidatus Moranbacteria bacterium]